MIGFKSQCVHAKPGLALVRRSKARRCLFGPVDHEEVKKSLRQEMDRIDEENNARWNFDFATGTPLKGKLQWHEVNSSEDIPSAYSMPNLSIKLLARYAGLMKLDTKLTAGQTLQANAARGPSRKRKQSEITDYFPARKIARLAEEKNN